MTVFVNTATQTTIMENLPSMLVMVDEGKLTNTSRQTIEACAKMATCAVSAKILLEKLMSIM